MRVSRARRFDVWTDADQVALGQEARRGIVRRTSSGVDAGGRRFAPHQGVRQGQAVDLVASGRMLRSLRVFMSSGVVRIKPAVGYAVYVNRRRVFMGIDQAERRRLARWFLARARQRASRPR